MYPSFNTGLIAVSLSALVLAGCGGGGGAGGGIDGPGVIRGTIEVASGTRADGDTALNLTTAGLGSSRDMPINGVQNGESAFPGNVILGGYVSSDSGTYGNGFDYPQDDSDQLRLRLVDGQRVTVNLFPAPYDPGSDSASTVETRVALEAVDGSGDDVAGPNDEMTKTVQAQGDGEHDLVITSTGGGPARYVVRATSLSQGRTLGVSADTILPGEAIVTMERGTGSGQMRTQAGNAVALAGQQQALGGGQFRVRMPREREALMPASATRRDTVASTLEWIRALEKTPGVASVTPNHRVEALNPQTQQNYADQKWHYDLINLSEQLDGQGAWDRRDGSDVRAAVLDTGISRRDGDWHPELAPNIDCSQQGCFDAVDNDNFPLDTSTSKHGTHVTGTVGAAAEDGGKVTGVAHAVDLVPVRVLGSNEGSIADVIEGIRWVVNEGGQPRADLINLSLGSQTNNPSLADAIADAEAAGVIVVAASGNAGDDRRFFPAAYSSVLAVGSVDCTRERSAFSNFGVWLDLVAPGGGGSTSDCGDNSEAAVFSTIPGSVGGLQGTSMAAPHVSGVMAMLREGDSDLSPAVARALIREGRIVQGKTTGAFDIETGRGLIDADAAASSTWSDYAALSPDREVFELDEDNLETEVQFRRVGNASASPSDLTVTGAAEWLDVAALGGRRFRVSLNTDEMTPGIFYQSRLEVTYSAGGDRAFDLPVTATLDTGDEGRNAGAHFVQLIPVDDSNPDQQVVQTLVEASGGRYSFRFDTSDIEPGQYHLISGTDMDNDGAFCGPGEACAEHLSGGSLREIEVTPTMNESVTLETAFTRPVDTQADPGYRRLNNQ